MRLYSLTILEGHWFCQSGLIWEPKKHDLIGSLLRMPWNPNKSGLLIDLMNLAFETCGPDTILLDLLTDQFPRKQMEEDNYA